MESEGSITVSLEACRGDSILLETVKDMVNENSHAELENEEESFFVISNVHSEQQNEMDISNEDTTVIQSNEQFSWSSLCRVCANASDHLIPIFEGEGLQHDLYNKIHKYLPIHISEDDTLPLQLCYHCAATLLAWHDLLEGCLSAERRLLEMYDESLDKQDSKELESSLQDTSISIAESFQQHQETVKDEVAEELTVIDSGRWKIEPRENESTKAEEMQMDYIQCTQCDTFFEDMKFFISHMNTEHEAEVHYCQYCKLMYQCQESKFQEHVSMHNCKLKNTMKDAKVANNLCENDNPPSFTCNTCGKDFIKKSELKKHIGIHSYKRLDQNPEEVELMNKAKQMIDDRVSYKCGICKKIIFTKRGFLRHIRVHSNKRPCKCNLCGKSYRIEQDLARHIRDVHEGLKKYACDICGRAFANKGAKDDHRRIHTGERPYACEHCPKMFRTLNSIYIHNRVHTDYKPHKCSYCDKHFRSRQRLTHHETTHTGIKAFACDICGKTFSVKGEVVRHRATHNVQKPYHCKCGMKFGQKRYLRNHIKLRHKEVSSRLLAELLGEK